MKLCIDFPVVLTEPGIIVVIKAEDIAHMQETWRLLQYLEGVNVLLAFYEKEDKHKVIIVLTSKDSETLEKKVKNLIEEQKRKYPDFNYQIFKYKKFGKLYLCKEPIKILLRNEPGFIMRYRYEKDIISVLTNAFGEGIYEALYIIFRVVGNDLAQFYGKYIIDEPVEKLVEFVLIGSAFVGWVPKIKSLKRVKNNEILVDFDEEEFRGILNEGWSEEGVKNTLTSISKGLIEGFLEFFGYECKCKFLDMASAIVTFSEKK